MILDSATGRRAFLEKVAKEFQRTQPASRRGVAGPFLSQWLEHAPYDEFRHGAPERLAAIVASAFEAVQLRKQGETLVRVYNPSLKNEGWESDCSIVELVNDDRPFLVDTATLTLVEMGVSVHRVVHPVLCVQRDDRGRLQQVLPPDSDAGIAESLIQLHVDRCTDAKKVAAMAGRLQAAMSDVKKATSDWPRMEACVAETAALMPQWAPGVEKSWMKECRTFLEWLLDENFVFLGIRDYEISGSGSKRVLKPVPGSGLGILREAKTMRRSRPLSELSPKALEKSHKRPLIVTKTNARSTVHRAGYMDYVGVLRIDEDGRAVAERRIIGLFTSRAYNRSWMSTPLVRVRARNIIKRSGLPENSHAWKTMVHVLETLPRDELFQASSRQLRSLTGGVLAIRDRKRVRLFVRRERYGRYYSCLIYLPREWLNTESRERVQDILLDALEGESMDYFLRVAESRLARVHVIVRAKPGSGSGLDIAGLEKRIAKTVRPWDDELEEILVEKLGREDGQARMATFGRAFPAAYREDVSPWVAAFDVENAAAVEAGEAMRLSLYRPRQPRDNLIRFKLFRMHDPIPLTEVMPVLRNLGFNMVNERPYELSLPGERSLWIQDFDMRPVSGGEVDLDAVRALFEDAFRHLLEGAAENDGFNRLVIASHMHWRQVAMLRAYGKYLRQTNIPFSQRYMADSVCNHPGMARILVELFEARFDPQREKESRQQRREAQGQLDSVLRPIFAEDCRRDPGLAAYLDELIEARLGAPAKQAEAARRAFERGLQFVMSLDEDRILFAFFEAIEATLRTNFFQAGPHGETKSWISFKIDSGALPELPRPRPFREIWVYSPDFEGVHLRGGMIARGGLRWSDRREDFRTEVLGLMKAQNVKNTMIVPVGAKGGFVVKNPPREGGREAVFREGVRCYTRFIHGLLDITDNLDGDRVVPPADVKRHDVDDPYLVVAADKGTATFSDTANGVAAEHGHWLGDAFASGGSVGYDHKAMGITARGAWEAVKHHFREMGVDIQKEPFTVVGIGDMSGDVFGNGMLLSRHIRLKAAFNHMHIFLDPHPDEKASYAERRRLFRRPGSTWMDYRKELISSGGGVFLRTEKAVPISPEVGEWLGISEEELSPNELIRSLLKAEFDLLWNGGIGTYVKASAESHADVGDLANNALRVNGSELGCRVIGEGGNLGLTQRGRIEFARNGGRVNTDFIDNSAGVDTSDHEVNIKILLNQVMAKRRLGMERRNALLEEMSEEVAQQVLRNTYLQTQAISLMAKLSPGLIGAMGHFISVLEDEGSLDRELEFLPSEEDLAARRKQGAGLTRPELAVLLSYSKITLYRQLLESNVPEDEWLSAEAVNYFPAQIREAYAHYVGRHRLKREIVATQVTNSLVNRMGATFALRMQEDTGCQPCDVARAYTIAREVFAARDFWAQIERLDNRVDAGLQMSAMLEMWYLLRQATRWLLGLPQERLEIDAMVKRLAPGIMTMEKIIGKRLRADQKEALNLRAEPFAANGFGRRLGRRIALLPHLFPALDVVETAARRKMDVERVADVFYALGGVLQVDWLRQQIEALEVAGKWHAMSRANLREELLSHHNRLVEQVLSGFGRRRDPVADWLQAHSARVDEAGTMLEKMKEQAEMDYATLSVAVRSLGKLADDTADD
jgi:glutamate dehydrogenase